MNTEKYDAAIGKLWQMATDLSGCRDAERIRRFAGTLRNTAREIEASLDETLLDAKEVPQFSGMKCDCGEPRLTAAKFCVSCGKRFERQEGADSECG